MLKRFRVKKGFTLIELLAVIVILAVILLIVIPIVLGVIEDSRKGSFESSTYGLAKTAENACMSYALRHDPVARETLFTDGEMTGYELNFTGKPPEGGYVHINEQCQVEMAVHNGEWCATKGYHEIEVTLTPYDGDCSLGEVETLACSGDLVTEENFGSGVEAYLDNGTLCLRSDETATISTDGAFSGTWWMVFGGNNNITEIIILDNITHIDECAFGLDANCGSLWYNPDDEINVELVNNSLEFYLNHPQPAKVELMNIPASWAGIESLIIGDSVTTIDDEAFYGNQLTSVIIPDSVTVIGTRAFSVNEINEITLGNSVTEIKIQAFSHNHLTSVTIPDSVTHLSGFHQNQINSIIIPNSVIEIGSFAFSYNELTSVTIPDNVITIGRSSFSQNEISKLTIGNSVELIEGGAFEFNQLTSVTIPESVTYIGGGVIRGAFRNNQLVEITFLRDDETTTGWQTFRNNGPSSNSAASNLDCSTVWSCTNTANFYGTWDLNPAGDYWILQCEGIC